jgi:hypothetical protein
MTYTDILASRGYRRAIVTRTQKAAGDLVLCGREFQRVPGEAKVTPIGRRRGRG